MILVSHNFCLHLLPEEKNAVWSVLVLAGAESRLEVTVARSTLCFDGVLAQKVCALLLKEPVSLPLCGHRSSDLLSNGSGKRDKLVDNSSSHFPSPNHWLPA